MTYRKALPSLISLLIILFLSLGYYLCTARAATPKKSGKSSTAKKKKKKPRKNKITHLAASVWTSGVVTNKGYALMWGYNSHGQLGDGTREDRHRPVLVKGLKSIKKLALGGKFSVALLKNGTVWTWGGNYPVLGDGSEPPNGRMKPKIVPGLRNVSDIDAGSTFIVALLGNGKVAAWGRNDYGQMGNGTGGNKFDKQLKPGIVPGLSDVKMIGAGVGHVVAIKTDGTVMAWGYNCNYQVGDGTKENRFTPVKVGVLKDMAMLEVGLYHALVLHNDGTLSGWGRNPSGQFGDGTSKDKKNGPVKISTIAGVEAIASRSSHTVFLMGNGRVMTAGKSIYGALGDGSTEKRTTPAIVPGLSKVIMITADSGRTMVFTENQKLYSWGRNKLGQVGNGTSGDGVTKPVRIKVF